MTKQLRHILLAIGDLQRSPKNELRKGAALAEASGASVELFHAIDEPDPFRSYPETATLEAVKKQRAAIVAESEARLRRFARDPCCETSRSPGWQPGIAPRTMPSCAVR